MSETPNLNPTGLSRSEFKSLCEYQYRAGELTAEQLGEKVNRHLEQTRMAHERNRLVNLRLALAMTLNAHSLLGQWNQLAPSAKSWLAGAILYFAESQGDEPDFTSALGLRR